MKCSFSNGCPEQFKSRHSAFELIFLCVECNINEYVHTFTPTVQFKCACDSCGNDNKQWLRQEELSGNIRENSAWLAFQALKQMPLPQQRIRNFSNRFQIFARHQYFVVYEKHLMLFSFESQRETKRMIALRVFEVHISYVQLEIQEQFSTEKLSAGVLVVFCQIMINILWSQNGYL